MQESLSSILDQTLDIGISGPSTASSGIAKVSAASILLREKQKSQREILSSDFVPFNSKAKQQPEKPLLAQISASSVDAPTYWKSNGGTLSQGVAIKNQKGKNGNNKPKAHKSHHHEKGEKYADRMQSKLSKKSKLAPPKKGKGNNKGAGNNRGGRDSFDFDL